MSSLGTRRLLVLIALALSTLVVGIDLTVLNVALPTIAPVLHASTSDLQWFVDAYSLALAATLLPLGLLGDRFGRKRLLLVELAAFGAMSAVCAYATSSGELIAARAVLGLAAAAIIPLSMAMLSVLFTAQERPRAMALLMTATVLAFPLGPVLGGWLLTHFWWGSVFLINVPVVVLALIAVAVLMPESRNPQAPMPRPVGVLLSSAGLVGLTYGVVSAGQHGWSDTGTVASLLAGAALLAVFVLNERRTTARGLNEPLVDLSLFRSAGFSWGTTLATLISFALFGLMFAMPLYFQNIQGADALGSGLRMLPLVGGLLVGGQLAGRLQTPSGTAAGGSGRPRLGARPVVAIGFAAIGAGLGLGATTGAGSGTGFAAAWFAVVGFGLGFALPASMNAALGTLSRERSGAGSAVIMALRQVGGTIGVAILGTVLSTVYRGRLNDAALPAALKQAAGRSVSQDAAVAQRLGSQQLLTAVHGSFIHALDVMLAVSAAIAVAAMVLAWLFLPRQAATRPPAATDEPALQGEQHVVTP